MSPHCCFRRRLSGEDDHGNSRLDGSAPVVNLTENRMSLFSHQFYKNGNKTMLHQLLQDEAGFVISAELVLIATILVVGLIVGLSEIQHAVVQELNDVADAIGSINQSYLYTGFSAEKTFTGGVKSYTRGSAFADEGDDCDNNQCDLSCDIPVNEGPKTF